MPADHLTEPTAVRRRTVLLGAGGALTAASASSCGRENGGPAAATGDEELVDRVVGRLRAQEALLRAIGQRHAGLRRQLRPWLALHRAHLAELDADPADAADGTAAAPAPTPRAAALAEVRGSEAALQRALVQDAVAATSGELAQLLASMSAAVAQRLVVQTLGPVPRDGADR